MNVSFCGNTGLRDAKMHGADVDVEAVTVSAMTTREDGSAGVLFISHMQYNLIQTFGKMDFSFLCCFYVCAHT